MNRSSALAEIVVVCPRSIWVAEFCRPAFKCRVTESSELPDYDECLFIVGIRRASVVRSSDSDFLSDRVCTLIIWGVRSLLPTIPFGWVWAVEKNSKEDRVLASLVEGPYLTCLACEKIETDKWFTRKSPGHSNKGNQSWSLVRDKHRSRSRWEAGAEDPRQIKIY